MNKDASEFMLQEYERISTAYFGLRDQVNEMFKAYLTLVGLPLTVLAAVLKLGEDRVIVTLGALPDVVSGLLVVVALLGFFVTLTIISMRMEMILYARTINGVRRYFGQLDLDCPPATPHPQLTQYLILPTSDAFPPFFESWRAMFWQVCMVGALDGIIFGAAMQSLLRSGWLWAILIGLGYALWHLGWYRYMAWRRSREWIVRYPTNL